MIKIDHGYIDAEAERLRGTEIILPIPSVGATVNIMMAAVRAEGKTVIENAAREPEVVEIATALKSGGARIEGEETGTITIDGVEKIEPFHHRVIPDRIEAGTFAAAAVVTGGRIEINDCRPDHLNAVVERLESCGAEIELFDNRIIVTGPETVTPADVETGYYPAFPTDMQAQMIAVLCRAKGASTVTEHVYTKRFTHVPELNRLGANITVSGNVAVVNGVEGFQGAPVMATDIRASSALILAGLAAEGETKILRIYHIDRGYERMEDKLRGLGARIERIKD
jgi:UDP-N-acetylglucosamine 1-carboxyvinyltransferase